MGQLTLVCVAIAVVGVLLVNGSTQEDRGDDQTANTKASLEGDLRLLCDELEQDKYSLNRTLFKLKALQFLTANWTRFFTLYENPLCWLYGLLILPVAAAAVLVHYCYKRRSRKVKKLPEAETERLKAGGAYQDCADDHNHNHNHNNHDPVCEDSPLAVPQESQIKELARFNPTDQLPLPAISTMPTPTTRAPRLASPPRQLVNSQGELARCTACAALHVPCSPAHCRNHQPVYDGKQVRAMQRRQVNPFVKKSNCIDCQEELITKGTAGLETKDKVGWATKFFGKSPYLKRRDYSGSVEDYKDYVKSKVKPRMFVSSNQSSAWSGYLVEEGQVGIVTSTNDVIVELVEVKWLTLEAGDPAYRSEGLLECLDLLTSPHP